jgi:pimeloyl-ACP methyl ester carboxylesterase
MPHVQRPYTTLYYELHSTAPADAPALVLAHGAGGNTLIWWQQIPFFARTHRVLVFDHRGFGRSTCAPGHFHAREFADDLRSILDHARIERAALVCQSMGGWTCLRSALSFPQRVAALVLSGTPGGVFTPKVLEAFRSVGRVAETEGITGRPALAPDFPKREPERAFLYDRISGLNGGLPPAALATLAQARIAPAELADYRVPTLMISGEHDQLFPPEALKEAAAQIPGCRVHDFAGAGHSPYFEDAPRFNRIVADFLQKVS